MAPEWYVAKGKQKLGPYTLPQLQQLRATGQLLPTDMILQVGAHTWQPADSLPPLPILTSATDHRQIDLFPHAAAIQVQENSPPIPRISPTTSTTEQTDDIAGMDVAAIKRHDESESSRFAAPWNPVAIAWLGLLFSPLWAGILATLNIGRLQCNLPIWRPVVIAVACLILTVFLGTLVDSFALDLSLYLLPLGLIWYFDLRPQTRAFTRYKQTTSLRARWRWPFIAGSPVALFVLCAFVVQPLMPLEPMAVVERFLVARTAKQMSPYVTNNLLSTLEPLEKLWREQQLDQFEILGSEPAPPNLGGHIVLVRGFITAGGRQVLVEALVHLICPKYDWKIEEIYITGYDRKLMEPPERLTGLFPDLNRNKPTNLAQNTAKQAPPEPQAQPQPKPPPQQPLPQQPQGAVPGGNAVVPKTDRPLHIKLPNIPDLRSARENDPWSMKNIARAARLITVLAAVVGAVSAWIFRRLGGQATQSPKG